MPSEVDLTAGQLRLTSNLFGSRFKTLYSGLMRAEPLSDDELVDVLRFAVLFSRSSDTIVSRLGYRIVLQYAEVTRDYEPLHAIAERRDLTPVSEAAERLNPSLVDDSSLTSLLRQAHRENFVTVEADGSQVFRTRGQMELRSFNSREREAVVVAPTSYGKSEMLIEKLVRSPLSATAVIVPSRALIAQTRASVVRDPRIQDSRVRVLTHPDAYTDESHFIAIMTQERLQRLLVDHPQLTLDQLLVDEAHNLLPGGGRSAELSRVILVARKRNPDLSITYYTPFIGDPGSLRHVNGVDDAARSKTINEHVKAEKFIIAPLGGQQTLYDQFLNRFIPLGQPVPTDELDAVLSTGGHRTLVYVNRPRDAQELAKRLAERVAEVHLTPQAKVAISAIGDLIDPDYSLIEAIRSGVLFHHGQVPDSLRQYIEELFREDASVEPRFLVTTSTLLEGVNTPADCLVMMTASRGRGHLTRSAFRNLIGRVGRFKELFAPSRSDLDLLQPRIFLVPSGYARANWNVENYLTEVANLAKAPEEVVANPLLERSPSHEGRKLALEYLENIEPGASGLLAAREAETEVGRACFRHGVQDFDIFEVEHILDARMATLAEAGAITEVAELVDAICSVFLEAVPLRNSEDLDRLVQNAGARRFYSMFIGWRARNEPFKRMIGRFVRYWSGLDEELVFVGQKWGEEPYGVGANLYVRMRTKTQVEKINLAVVKIKEEQDFVDFRLVKYIEILNGAGLIGASLYLRVKYGSDDPYLICLLRNGFSPELARGVKEDFAEFVEVNVNANTATVSPGLPNAMQSYGFNDILVYEARTLVNSGLEISI